MPKMAHIAVVFNEPTIATEKGRMFISAEGQVGALASHSEIVANMPSHLVDMSEVGVIEEREQVEKALQNKGYRTSLFNIDGDIKRLINFIEVQKPDLIFNLCESLMGESLHEMHVAGIYELMNIPYTGAATLALGTCLNKVRTKEILRCTWNTNCTAYHYPPMLKLAISTTHVCTFHLLLNQYMKMQALVLKIHLWFMICNRFKSRLPIF